MIFTHIVTWNSEKYIQICLESLLSQEGFSPTTNSIWVTDNGSSDRTTSIVKTFPVTLIENRVNLGFCAAHNQVLEPFLRSPAHYLLIVNPDVRLTSDCIKIMMHGFKEKKAGLVTPKLFRADEKLNPVIPQLLDAAGMELTPAIRHFDRGSNKSDIYFKQEDVFGGTGACLLLSRHCVEDLLLPAERDDSLLKVFPEYKALPRDRKQLFDEAFFAYREDADLSWRANHFGWRCIFVPEAIGYHRRVVLPDNRDELSEELNGLSVRNRFLLQINNYFFCQGILFFVCGFIFRNLVVLAGVLFKERKSLKYLADIKFLWKRAIRIRSWNAERSHRSATLPRTMLQFPR